MTDIHGARRVGGDTGTMVVRVVQSDQSLVLPPDLLTAAPKLPQRVEAAELVTLIDMDHYVEGTVSPDSEWIVARTYEMHDDIIETFHEHVVTPEAIEEWK